MLIGSLAFKISSLVYLVNEDIDTEDSATLACGPSKSLLISPWGTDEVRKITSLFPLGPHRTTYPFYQRARYPSRACHLYVLFDSNEALPPVTA